MEHVVLSVRYEEIQNGNCIKNEKDVLRFFAWARQHDEY